MKVPLLHMILFILLIGISKYSAGQNLVPNWSFELIDSCPSGHYMASDTWLVQNWSVPPGSITTPDLFSTCFNGSVPIFPHENISVPQNFMGNAYPKTGDNYMGMLLKYGYQTGGENLQVNLTTPMTAGQSYLCGFNVMRADSSYYIIDKIGMHISDIPQPQIMNQTMPLSPQIENTSGLMYDSINWINVEDVYVASGGEQFITIGNFYNNVNTIADSILPNVDPNWALTGYYLLDDVYIFPYEENLQTEFPDQVCSGETITLSATGSVKYEWYVNGVWYSSDSTISFIADQNTQISVAGYEDSLSHFIEVIDCPIDCSGEPIMPNVFTPNGDNINDYFYPKKINSGCYTITILNRWGNQIYHCNKDQSFWDGTTQNGENVTEGVYFYIVEVEDNFGVKRTYHGHVTVSK